jgi:cytochrome P450
VQRIIQERKHNLAIAANDVTNEDKYGDILSMYMKAARDSRKPYLADDDYLQDVVLNFMVAGRDTTSSTLTNLFRHLSNRPDVAKKMLDEMAAALQKDGSSDHIGWDHIKDLPYSGSVFNEVLRLHPPVAGDFRMCAEECQLPSGLVIPKGARVSIMVAAIGRDSNLWPDADEFIPERWLDQEDPTKPTKRIPEYLLPAFWAGPRICLGKDAARLEVLSTAHAILAGGIKFKLVPNQDEKIKIGPVQFYEAGVKVEVKKC